MKNILLTLFLFSFFLSSKATIHEILVWDGYFQFLPYELNIELGDTIQWLPLDSPSMMHTITSAVIPEGAAEFDQVWQLPADTFFQYVPEFIGVYNYVCTPHEEMGMIASFTVTDPLTKVEELSAIDLLIYPNPCIDRAMVNLRGLSSLHYSSLTAIIRSADGSIVQELHFETQASSDLSFYTKDLEAGIYLVSILADDKQLKNSRLIVL